MLDWNKVRQLAKEDAERVIHLPNTARIRRNTLGSREERNLYDFRYACVMEEEKERRRAA
jgi:hypothetical protein